MGVTSGTVLARLGRTEALVEIDGRDRLVSTARVQGLRPGERVLVGPDGVIARAGSPGPSSVPPAPSGRPGTGQRPDPHPGDR